MYGTYRRTRTRSSPLSEKRPGSLPTLFPTTLCYYSTAAAGGRPSLKSRRKTADLGFCVVTIIVAMDDFGDMEWKK